MRNDTEIDYKEKIVRTLIYIQKHLDETLTLSDLAKVAYTSEFHFHRIFRGIVGEPVMSHVRRLRLERAAYRLKLTKQPVTRIAFDSGYETHESFTRAFSDHFGCPPSVFRNNHRNLQLSKAPSGVHYSPDGVVEEIHMAESVTNIDVKIKQIDTMRVAFVRHTGAYNEVGVAWDTLCNWAGPKGLLGNEPFVAVSYDDPGITPEEKLRYDACIVVDETVKPEGEVGVQDIGGGKYAVYRHEGPYHKLSESYALLCGEWLLNQEIKLVDSPAIEFYLNSPMDTAPEDLLTDICIPIK